MIRIVCAIACCGTFLLVGVPAGNALSGDAPWCAVVNIGNGEIEWDCHYQTVEQCAPNVIAGNRGFCNHNPYYRPGAATPPPHHKPYVRRHLHHN